MTLLDRLGLTAPIIQAPMAGTSTPLLAARVSEAGALGSIAVGAVNAADAADMIAEVRSLTDRPFNVNLFVHAPARCRRRDRLARRLGPHLPILRRRAALVAQACLRQLQ
jgi:nitronate monooxygenase